MNNKARNHVRSIKPLGTPVLNIINKIIIKKRGFSSPDRIGCHNHPKENYCHSEDAALNKKRNEIERLKERYQ
jgi:hypothetical protein